MIKSTTILTITVLMLIMASSVISVSSESDEQAFVFASQENNKQPQPKVSNNLPVIITIIFVAGLWYFEKDKHGGK